MRRVRIALGVSMAIMMTLAQACVATPNSVPSVSSAQAASLPANDPPAAPGGTGGAATARGTGTSAHIDTTGYTKDQSTSQALTEYLTQHKLPLVGAQVLTGPSGGRAVVLYGFTGSDFGKGDAVTKTRKYLQDSTVAVDNRIRVNPDLLTANNPGTTRGTNGAAVADSAPDPADNMPGADSYTQHQNDIQQYAQSQSNGAAMSPVNPLLLMGLGMALAIASGGMVSIGSGSMGPPGANFGGAPYNPYPGYPSSNPSSPSINPGPDPYGP